MSLNYIKIIYFNFLKNILLHTFYKIIIIPTNFQFSHFIYFDLREYVFLFPILLVLFDLLLCFLVFLFFWFDFLVLLRITFRDFLPYFLPFFQKFCHFISRYNVAIIYTIFFRSHNIFISDN